jgi:hypothetical protein
MMVEEKTKQDFIDTVNFELYDKDVFSVKFQRNLYYTGVGSSDGYKGKTKGFKKVASGEVKLEESFIGFICYKGGK